MTNTTIARRPVLPAAWAVPVVLAAASAPLAAASAVKRSRIAFTNVTATEGAVPRTVYANTKVMLTDGPDPVKNLRVTITAGDFTETWAFPEIAGWGVTPPISVSFAAPDDVTVHFRAVADGVEEITGEVLVKAPGWWK